MKSASIADVEAQALADAYMEDARHVGIDRAIYAAYRAGRDAATTDYEVHRAAFHMAAAWNDAHGAAVRVSMSGWTVVDGHAVRTATLILSGMVGALVLVVFIMGGHEHVWWAGLVALAGWLLLFVPRFVREDRRWRKERK